MRRHGYEPVKSYNPYWDKNLIMIATLVGLYAIGGLFSFQPITIALQVIAVALMAWARDVWTRHCYPLVLSEYIFILNSSGFHFYLLACLRS